MGYLLRCTFTFTETLQLEDVVHGDVWLCSGQSNMEQVNVKSYLINDLKHCLHKKNLIMFITQLRDSC